jgi:hypothetical protein
VAEGTVVDAVKDVAIDIDLPFVALPLCRIGPPGSGLDPLTISYVYT